MQRATLAVFTVVLLCADRLPAQAPSTELRDAPGKDVVVRLCGECHDAASRITKFRKTETEWADVITDMQNRGLMADDKDLAVVLAYLAKNYGPDPAARIDRARQTSPRLPCAGTEW